MSKDKTPEAAAGWAKLEGEWYGPDETEIDVEDDGSITIRHDVEDGGCYGYTSTVGVRVPLAVLRDLVRARTESPAGGLDPAAVLDVLRLAEWAGQGNWVAVCPVCYAERGQVWGKVWPHAGDCGLAAMIDECEALGRGSGPVPERETVEGRMSKLEAELEAERTGPPGSFVAQFLVTLTGADVEVAKRDLSALVEQLAEAEAQRYREALGWVQCHCGSAAAPGEKCQVCGCVVELAKIMASAPTGRE